MGLLNFCCEWGFLISVGTIVMYEVKRRSHHSWFWHFVGTRLHFPAPPLSVWGTALDQHSSYLAQMHSEVEQMFFHS